jgi:DNA-binding GntR family transcriptional regulator
MHLYDGRVVIDQPKPLKVHPVLRRKIMLGEYAQGEVLSETRLAQDLSVSRVPVREVLPLLQQEGFVETAPRRRSVVTTWTPRLINDLFDARLGVEVAAVAAAARRMRGEPDPEARQAFEVLSMTMDRSEHNLAEDHPLDLALSNAEVHVAFAATSGNPLFEGLMRLLSGRMAWIFYLTSGRDLHGQSHEHHALLDAMQAGNVRLSEALMYAHIESGRQPTLNALHGLWRHEPDIGAEEPA